MLYTEIARQKGDDWSWRRLVPVEDVGPITGSDDEAAWYRTTFDIEVEEGLNVEESDVSKLFESCPKQGDLFFDFDSATDITKAREDVLTAYDLLTGRFGIGEDDARIYYSGKKGYHLIVPWSALGLGLPRPDAHLLYRRFASNVVNGAIRNKTLDLKVYNPRRLLRVPGSIHLGTGARKVRLSVGALRTGDHVPYANGRPSDSGGEQEAQPHVSYLLQGALSRIDSQESESRTKQYRLPEEFLIDPLDCIRTVLSKGVPVGRHNDTVYTVALYFKCLGLGKGEAYDRIVKSVLGTERDHDEREVARTVASAYSTEKRFGLRDNVVLEEYVTERDKNRFKRSKVEEEYESLSEVVSRFREEFRHPESTKVGKYYVDALDAKIGGLIGGELVVLGGTTGTGKSEFAFHVAYENAKSGVPTAFISLELSNRDFVARLVRAKSGIDPEKFWSQDLTEEDKAKVEEITDEMEKENLPIFFRKRKSMMNVEEMEDIIKSLVVEKGCRLVIVDHLHYLSGKNTETENQNVAQSIRAVNSLCLRYNIGVICVAHFRKQPDSQHRPSMHEFRDTSAIEQEASTILILWRNMEGFGEHQYITEFKLAKSRKDIPLGTVTTRFNPLTRQYESL